MYQRKSQSGHTVEWSPKHDEEAEEAMLDVVGEVGVEVDKQTAKEVRKRYQELINAETE